MPCRQTLRFKDPIKTLHERPLDILASVSKRLTTRVEKERFIRHKARDIHRMSQASTTKESQNVRRTAVPGSLEYILPGELPCA